MKTIPERYKERVKDNILAEILIRVGGRENREGAIMKPGKPGGELEQQKTGKE